MHATSWHSLSVWVGCAFYAQNCRTFGESQGLLWLPEPAVLAHEVAFSLWQKGIPFYTVGCRRWGVVTLPFPHELCLRELEGSPCQLGKIDWIPRGGNLHQIQPPSWGLHLVGTPPHQLLGVIKGWLGHCRLVGFFPSTTRCLCLQQEFTHMRV